MNGEPRFVPVRVNTLRPDSVPGFEIFVQVGGRHVHYWAGKDPIDPERLKKLRDAKVKKLFIPEAEEDRYLAYLDESLATLKPSAGSDMKVQAQVAHAALVTAAENAERSLETESNYRRTEGQFLKVVDFLMNDRRAVKSVLEASGTSLDDHQHAANVTTLALSLCSRGGISDPAELLNLGFAGLLHDLGKQRLGIDPLKPRSDYTAEERRKYERHPDESVALLSGKPFITPRVLGIIQDHEEIGRGRGFPNKKDIAKLATAYQIFNLANAFDRHCMEKAVSPLVGLDSFYEIQGELFDAQWITVLGTVLT